MRILVTGSRVWPDTFDARAVLANALLAARDDEHLAAGANCALMTLVHGAAFGADEMAAEYASRWKWHVEPHTADWGRYGRSAGHRRNAEMVAAGADVLLAFYATGQKCVGTGGCVQLALNAGIEVRVFDELGPLDFIPPLRQRHTRTRAVPA